MTSNSSDHAFTRMAEQIALSHCRGHMQSVAGIDVLGKKLDICALFDSKMKREVVDNPKSGFKILHSWLLKLQIENIHVCMESTGCYSEDVAEFLHNLNFKVSVVNPIGLRDLQRKKNYMR